MSKTNVNEIYNQYQQQLQSVEQRESQSQSQRAVLSPISETDSNKYATIDTQGQTVRRINPDEERKLTGTGSYNIDAAGDAYQVDDENDYYSDDFESDEDDDSETSSVITGGCSGSTAISST